MNVVPELGSSEDAECPVTLEEYKETGEQQPLKLPRCGHTYSRKGISMLLDRARSLQGPCSTKKGRVCQVQCPTCRLNSRIKDVNDCKVDHEAIQALRKQAAERASKKLLFQQSRKADGIGVDASDSSEQTRQPFAACNTEADRCPVPEIVRKPRATNLLHCQLHDNRQLLFGEVRRSVHKVVKHIVCDNDIEDTCHTLTDYILMSPTEDVLDFLTAPLIAFEVIHSVWCCFEFETFEIADQIGDAALRHQIAMMLAMPSEAPAEPGGEWDAHKSSLRSLLCHLVTCCCTDLFPGVSLANIKPIAADIVNNGLQLCPTESTERYSHIWLQPQHFCHLAASGVRACLSYGTLDPFAGLLPDGPTPPLVPLVDGLAEKTRALLRPLYGDPAATPLARSAATLIAANAADYDSALVLMHGGADLRAVVEDVVDAIAFSAAADFDGGGGGPRRCIGDQPCVMMSLKVPADEADDASFACMRSRELVQHVWDLYERTRGRGEHSEHSGRAASARGPPGTSDIVYSNGAASGGGGQEAPVPGLGPRAATLTPQDLFSGSANAGRVSLDPHQANNGVIGAAAYSVPPPVPVAVHARTVAAKPAAVASSSRGNGGGGQFVGVPLTAKFAAVDETSGTQTVLPERRDRAPCTHFQKHGWCELGMHCAMGHPGGRSVRFNLLGYPIRPGQRVCKFFMEHAKCKFGKNCRFNHPNIAYKDGPLAGTMVTST